ncbi:MAG: HD domain-containing protein [Lachnospiraceae bacterium]|nr:HD domain-containing protein [Lachnospiraceae bacterium]
METRQQYDEYIRHMKEIRVLSTPSLDGIKSAESYSTRLRENFIRIGMIASENRKFLDEILFPLLHCEGRLDEADVTDLDEFCDKLLNAVDLDACDPVITAMVADRLYKDSSDKGAFMKKIRNMDVRMSTVYTLMNITDRLLEYPEIALRYREMGFEMSRYFLLLRRHENFADVEDVECREMILTNSRFASAFYENLTGDREKNKDDLALLEENLALVDDPFYPPLVPDFDWGYYKFRVLSYCAVAADYNNARGFDKEQLALICKRTEQLWDLWHEDPERYAELEEEEYLEILRTRNRFLAGKMPEEQYLREMLSYYEKRRKSDYEMGCIAGNVLVPTEIMCILEGRRLTEADKALLRDFYNNIVNYVFLMPNSGILSYLLEYICRFLHHFIEIPESVHFEDLMLKLLAAMHPPTYVHSRMVAQFTACLCGHLIDMRPELLIGVCDTGSVEEVQRHRDKIIHFAYHAALCHDAGKLFIIDTVFVYGRKLEDMEFGLIKTHPKVGAEILKRYPSTAAYAEVALGHHKWYDNSRGYPEEFDTSKSKVKTIIDIVLCADCLDAATDTIGRSYNRGKTTDEFMEELKEGSGTRYAPWLVDLFLQKDVKADLEFLLKESREINYRNTYHLLKNAHEKTEKQESLGLVMGTDS